MSDLQPVETTAPVPTAPDSGVTKRPYQTPRLKVLGTFASLTQGPVPSGDFDTFGSFGHPLDS